MVLEGGDLGRSLGVEREALLSRNSAPIKETPQSSLAPLPREDTVRNLPPGREPLLNHTGLRIFDVRPPEREK